jgi:hypothetical protein
MCLAKSLWGAGRRPRTLETPAAFDLPCHGQMIRINARAFLRRGSLVLASVVTALGAGCYAGVYPELSLAGGPSAVAGPVANEGDVVHAEEPPVVDIESYPSVLYGGVTVYYVGGRWYQRGPRGWAYYRQEPSELGRRREEQWTRYHDPRWRDPRGAAQRSQDQRVPPAERRGVTEAQPAHP